MRDGRLLRPKGVALAPPLEEMTEAFYQARLEGKKALGAKGGGKGKGKTKGAGKGAAAAQEKASPAGGNGAGKSTSELDEDKKALRAGRVEELKRAQEEPTPKP